ncbi:MAG: FAD-dependent oxidoreductase [Myxococcales bacterium]|nr:FAD-dependent oxidoreductase [Myxococcales bacterium]
MSRKRYLIIGDGAAGTAAAQRLRELDGQAYITILSDDPQPAYFRAALTNYLLGELREEQIFAVPPSFYAEHHVHRVLTRVLAVDAARAQVWLSQGGQPLAYDALLVASGARANAPSFEGAALPGVMTMRTLQDARVVVDLCRVGLSQAVVLGGGPLALEWAHGMATRSAKVTMVVRETRFLPGVLDAVASDLLLARLRQRGVDVRMGETIAAAVPGPSGRVGAVRLTSGVMVPAQLVAAAIGVACNTEFLQNSGVTLSPQRAVVTDDRLRAGAPGLFAAGDVAAPGGKVLQLWEPARVQGRVAARNMVGGGEEAYTPGAHYMATRLYDLDCAAVGESAGGAAGTEDVVDFPQRTGRISYRKLVFRGGRLVGALLFGEREERVRQRGRAFKTLIDQGADVRAIQKELLDPTFDLAGYLRQNRLIEKPPVSLAGANVAAGAKVKGTQFVAIMPDSRGAPPPPKKAATMAVAAMGAPPDLAGVILLAGATQFPLRGPSAVIGRDPSAAQVVLADGMVSATHAQVARHDGGVYVRDLGSSNGTWVNGAPVTVPLRLSGGDRVRVGGVELLVSIDGQSTRADAHAPTGGPADARPHLEVRSGNALGLAFALTAPVVRIGRDPSCAVRLDDPSVSPVHAELREQGGAFHLADAQSVYGTSCGGQRLMPGHWATLKEGDAITIGQVALVFTARPTRLRAWEEMSMVSPGAGGA